MKRNSITPIGLPRHQVKHAVKSALVDTLLTLAGYIAAFSVRAVSTPLELIVGMRFMLLGLGLTLVSLYLHRVYHRLWHRTSGHGITVIVSAVAVTTVLLVIIDMFVQPRPLPVSVVILANVLAGSGFIAVRYRSRLIQGLKWRWRFVWRGELPKFVTDEQAKTHVLIVGAGEAGQALAMRLMHRSPNNNYKVVGFIDDDVEQHGLYVEGCQVFGARQQIPEIVKSQKVDVIVLAIHNISGPDFRDILNYCQQTQVRIKVVPDLFALMNDNIQGGDLLRDVEPEDLLGRAPIERHEDVDLSPVTGKVILVTGASGSIGSELSRQMLDYEPVKLIILDNNESALFDLDAELRTKSPLANVIPVLADITDYDTVYTVFEQYKPQIIFHAAAYKHVPMLEQYPNEALRVNIKGTLLLGELATVHNVERFVLVSTDKAVNAESVMGASKRVCELVLHTLAQHSSTHFTAVRFGNVLGSRGSVVPTFKRQIDNGGPVTITHREMTRYFMTIPEAVNLVIHAACLTTGDDIFILQMGEVVRIMELAERMIRLRGLRPHLDIVIEEIGIRPGEKMHEELYSASENPEATIHPYIIKLNTWDHNFDPGEFFSKLTQLVKQPLNPKIDPLDQLRDVVTSVNTRLPISGD